MVEGVFQQDAFVLQLVSGYCKLLLLSTFEKGKCQLSLN